MLTFDFQTHIKNFITEEEFKKYQSKKEIIKNRFLTGDLHYWMMLNSYISAKEIEDIQAAANKIRSNSEVFIVIGIGGSYMGSQAIIQALSNLHEKKMPEVIFLGTNLTSEEYTETLNYVKGKEISVNVISKSGTTLEPSIAFDLVMELMTQKYTEKELQDRIFITTDPKEGNLRQLANEKGYTSFNVPTNIGGRYSVLTPVGLLPIAVAGIDIQKLLIGAENGISLLDKSFEYAIIRDILYQKGYPIESFTIYNKKLTYFSEWLKQLFAETQGKQGKGILPISNINTRDLHSLGQFLQEGNPIIFETVIGIEEEKDITLKNYSVTLNELNKIALEKVAIAHEKGKTPSIIMWINQKNEETLGELIQFFMYSAIIGALLMEVNPFNQPGVQEYKQLIQEAIY